jgi:prepilin-type N-terminal cleavage/methylation domain-containing protein
LPFEDKHRVRGHARNPRRGMTLIEILVAVSLMGLLAVAMVTALTVGAGSWQDARSRLSLDRRIASANEIFYAELEGIVPVETRPDPSSGVTIPRAVFFQGEPEAMRFVTDYSLTAGRRAGLRIVELQIAEASRGTRVLVNEMPYRGPADLLAVIQGVDRDPLAGGLRLLFAPVQARPTSLILADELAECRFSYLRAARRQGEPALWIPQWTELNSLPSAIRIEMTPRQGEARLLPVTITAPVRARPGLQGGGG